jgi:hypothetical protein
MAILNSYVSNYNYIKHDWAIFRHPDTLIGEGLQQVSCQRLVCTGEARKTRPGVKVAMGKAASRETLPRC